MDKLNLKIKFPQNIENITKSISHVKYENSVS